MHSTGILRLDAAIGGLDSGVMIICGEAGAGKTALGARMLRAAAAAGKATAYISTVGAPEVSWLGDVDGVSIECGKGGEAATAAVECLRAGVNLVVIDTFETGYAGSAALGLVDMDDETHHESAKMYGLLAREGVWAASNAADACDGLVVLLVDTRAAQGRGSRLRPNLPLTIMHTAHTQLVVRKRATTSASGTFDYADIDITVQKCVRRPPGDVVETRLWPGVGIDDAYEKFAYLVQRGTLVRAGAYWKSAGGLSLGPGLLNAVAQVRLGLAGT